MATIATAAVNTITTSTGRVRLVCQICGRVSGSRPTSRLSDLPAGWSVAPYPDSFTHADGSTGDLFTCPPCGERRDFPIRPREYLTAIGGA